MHLLTTSSTTLDEIVEAVDLGQTPGDIVVLSFADSDLAGLAAAWQAGRAGVSSGRLRPSDVGRSMDRPRCEPRQSNRSAPARRSRLVEVRHRAAVGAGVRTTHCTSC